MPPWQAGVPVAWGTQSFVPDRPPAALSTAPRLRPLKEMGEKTPGPPCSHSSPLLTAPQEAML